MQEAMVIPVESVCFLVPLHPSLNHYGSIMAKSWATIVRCGLRFINIYIYISALNMV